MDIVCIVLQVQDNNTYYLGFDETLYGVHLCSVTWV